MKSKLSAIGLSLIMAGCASWGENYQSNYDGYLVTTSDCALSSVITLTVGGSTVTAPGANACGYVETPRHEADAYAPYFVAGVNAATAFGTVAYTTRENRKISEDDNATAVLISENNLKADQAMFETFATSQQSLIDSNQTLLDRLLPEDDMVITDPVDPVVPVIPPVVP